MPSISTERGQAAAALHSPALWTRREFLAAAGAAAVTAGCQTFPAGEHGILDCHTHFYDPARPEGVPWPAPAEKELYHTVLPESYRKLAEPLGIRGALVVEASTWVADNDWVLGLAAREPFLRGLLGNLKPGAPDFRADLFRLAGNPLFRGIRVRDVTAARLSERAVLDDLALLSEQGLALDLNGGTDLLPAISSLAIRLPRLRIVINHVANVRIDGQAPPRAWMGGMLSTAAHENVFCKVSGLVEGSGRRHDAPRDVNFYRPVLDHIFKCFGEDRLVFGSNWPVSAMFAELATVVQIPKTYFQEHGKKVVRKVFEQNAESAYRRG